MGHNIHLIIHNTAAIISAMALAYLIVFLLVNDHKKVVNITLALTALSVIVFLVSHVIGVSISDPGLSRSILMWNISVIFICMFNFHCVMTVLHLEKKKAYLVIFVYAVGLALSAFYIIFPDTFLLTSVPKMYFPNYYVAGQFHWVMRIIFQVILPLYFVYELSHAFRATVDRIEKNRILYFTVGLALGWSLGIFPDLLVYNIRIDPLIGIFFGLLFMIPFTYAVVRYELLDIRIIAKRAFIYGITVALVGGLLVLFNASNQILQESYPGFPFWIMPLASAAVAVAIGVIVWQRLKESDILKYEFITTATHKFRTPLTHIKWASENLSGMNPTPDMATQIDYIQSANSKLVELTNVLMNVSESENTNYDYRLTRMDVSSLAGEIIANSAKQADIKHVNISANLESGTFVSCDSSRMRFVIQTFIENAIHYTPGHGVVQVSALRSGNNVIFSVEDSGIGLDKEESSLIFSKFYRGNKARLADTEGMGIGLYICKEIIARHKGKIWAESEGRDKGSAFNFSLPAIR